MLASHQPSPPPQTYYVSLQASESVSGPKKALTHNSAAPLAQGLLRPHGSRELPLPNNVWNCWEIYSHASRPEATIITFPRLSLCFIFCYQGGRKIETRSLPSVGRFYLSTRHYTDVSITDGGELGSDEPALCLTLTDAQHLCVLSLTRQ